jgi:hypothetical protein
VEDVKKDKFEFLPLLSHFEDPAFTILNNKHTLMIKAGVVYVLVFLREAKKEAFVKCKVSMSGLDLLDTKYPIFTENIPEYRESKRIHKGLGINMYSL